MAGLSRLAPPPVIFHAATGQRADYFAGTRRVSSTAAGLPLPPVAHSRRRILLHDSFISHKDEAGDDIAVKVKAALSILAVQQEWRMISHAQYFDSQRAKIACDDASCSARLLRRTGQAEGKIPRAKLQSPEVIGDGAATVPQLRHERRAWARPTSREADSDYIIILTGISLDTSQPPAPLLSRTFEAPETRKRAFRLPLLSEA